MPRISLVPQRREFYNLYNRASANLVDIARLLVRLLDNFPNDRDTLAREIKDAEHEGDRLTHDVVDLLNRTFVTPFDRDDIYRLASALDDVCDHVDEAADNIDAYEVKQIPELARRQAEVIHRSALKLDEAVQLLEGFKDARRQLVALRQLEDEGDVIVREAVAGRFHSGLDALSGVRWKGIHQ